MIKVMFVCHGNICRSPMAEYVLKYLVTQKGLSDCFFITSSATSTEEIGNAMHPGTKKKLTAMKIPTGSHRAKQITRKDYTDFDYIICMDRNNIRNLKRHLGHDIDNNITTLLDYTNRPGDIADPWYTGDFDATYEDVLEGCTALLDLIISENHLDC